MTIRDRKLKKLEPVLAENLEKKLSAEEEFEFAEYDNTRAERTGYSNYSYYRP